MVLKWNVLSCVFFLYGGCMFNVFLVLEMSEIRCKKFYFDDVV